MSNAATSIENKSPRPKNHSPPHPAHANNRRTRRRFRARVKHRVGLQAGIPAAWRLVQGARCFFQFTDTPISDAGVVAASGGNHGVAVAFAAMKLGIRAKIFVPGVASEEKIARIRSYGAELVITGDRYADALAASESWVASSGATPIHAYDQIETLLGQGSVGLEWEEQCPELDTILVAVGGGGLIGGIATWYAGRVKIIGVEPEASPTLATALRAGKPVDSPAGGIAADSLAPNASAS